MFSKAYIRANQPFVPLVYTSPAKRKFKSLSWSFMCSQEQLYHKTWLRPNLKYIFFEFWGQKRRYFFSRGNILAEQHIKRQKRARLMHIQFRHTFSKRCDCTRADRLWRIISRHISNNTWWRVCNACNVSILPKAPFIRSRLKRTYHCDSEVMNSIRWGATL